MNTLVDGKSGTVQRATRCKQPMRIIAKRTLRECWLRCPETKMPLCAWYKEAKQADWANPAAVKETYCNASIVVGSRVIFNIMCNRHRLMVKIHHPYRVAYIRFVGTHAQYDGLDMRKV